MSTAAVVEEQRLLTALKQAVAEAPRKVREIEVGIPLSIALGKIRPAVACGGCATPLDDDGIPARTNTRLRAPVRLVLAEESPA